MAQEETIQILEELLNSVKIRGFKKTLNTLKTQTHKKVEVLDEFDRHVLQCVSDEFNIPTDDLLFSRYTRGDNKYAIGFCVYYLNEKKPLGEIHKKLFINKNKSLLTMYRQLIYNLNKSHKADTKFIELKNNLDKKIQNFKSDKV
jgi:NurA-like 5'-3' nuclease